jgi:predicted acylesterase/phospholipase RssA
VQIEFEDAKIAICDELRICVVNKSDCAILLGLSGGGFRATIFHLGVLRALLDRGLLSRVRSIAAVSGGAITAAHLVLNWDSYNDATTFPAQIKKFEDLTRAGIRNRLFRRIPYYWIRNRVLRYLASPYTTTNRLADYYDDWLFKDRNNGRSAVFSDLRKTTFPSDGKLKTPKLRLKVTNLSEATANCHFSSDGYHNGSHFVELHDYRIANAVAASSAFPLLFPALRFDHDSAGLRAAAFKLQTAQQLSDGGVLDNLGIELLRTEADQIKHETGNDPLIILSDAGAKLDWDLKTDFSQQQVVSLRRAIDVLAYWSEQRLLAATKTHNRIDISINDTVKSGTFRNVPEPETQACAGNFRTDLDKFNALEFTFLFDHGYAVTWTALDNALGTSSALPSSTCHVPWQDAIVNSKRSPDLRRKIDRLSKKRPTILRLLFRPFVGIDSFTIAYTMAIVVFLIVFSRYWDNIWRSGSLVVKAVEEFSLPSIKSKTIDFEKPVFMASSHLSGDLQLGPQARAALARAYKSLTPSGSNVKEEVIALVQKGGFDGNYRSSIRWIHFLGNARADAGVAFLIDPNASPIEPGYREVGMPIRNPSMELDGSVILPRINTGEFLVFVLKVCERTPNAEPTFPGKNVAGYQFSLESYP